jgi:hypothetical protein
MKRESRAGSSPHRKDVTMMSAKAALSEKIDTALDHSICHQKRVHAARNGSTGYPGEATPMIAAHRGRETAPEEYLGP